MIVLGIVVRQWTVLRRCAGDRDRGRADRPQRAAGEAMTLRACTVCGEPAEGSRCAAHRPRDKRAGRGAGHANDDAVFRAISTRLRRISPFCQFCGARDDLTVDHVIPTSQRPDLAREVLNMRVLCRSCNSRRGDRCTDAEQHAVTEAITARKLRKNGQGHPVARSSPQRGGGMPRGQGVSPRGDRQSLCYKTEDFVT